MLLNMKPITILCTFSIINGVFLENPLRNILKIYDKVGRPQCDGMPVNVSIDVALRQMIKLNEPKQAMTANIWMRMEWNDCRLRWNSSLFVGDNRFVVPEENIWIPDITLYNSLTQDSREKFRAIVNSDGKVELNYPVIVESSCFVDTTKFPFDTQRCLFRFGSWAYDGSEIQLLLKSTEGDLSSIIKNVEWDILSFPAKRNTLRYKCCSEPYYDVTFTVYIRRKPIYYILYLLFPSIFITLISLLSFILPMDSGENVSFVLTLMLALAVYQLMLLEMLPPSAETFPVIAIFFVCCIGLMGLSCVVTVITLNLNYKGEMLMPKWVRIIFLDKLSGVVCVDYKKISIEAVMLTMEIFIEYGGVTDDAITVKTFGKQFLNNSAVSMSDSVDLDSGYTQNASTDNRKSPEDDWKTLATVLNRLAAAVLTPTLIIIVGVVFNIMGT